VQGNENLSLQTIGKLETALGVPLISIKNSAAKRRKQPATKKGKR
jgi:hypothetical protein